MDHRQVEHPKARQSLTLYYLPEVIDEHLEPARQRIVGKKHKAQKLLISDVVGNGDNI